MAYDYYSHCRALISWESKRGLQPKGRKGATKSQAQSFITQA